MKTTAVCRRFGRVRKAWQVGDLPPQRCFNGISMYKHTFHRHKTREVRVGDVVVGGDNPIWVQSMTTPDTHDIEATVAQIHRLEEAGCEIVRVTVPKPEDAAVLGEIKRRIHLPLICDIHFDYKMALLALDHPVDKIRINP